MEGRGQGRGQGGLHRVEGGRVEARRPPWGAGPGHAQPSRSYRPSRRYQHVSSRVDSRSGPTQVRGAQAHAQGACAFPEDDPFFDNIEEDLDALSQELAPRTPSPVESFHLPGSSDSEEDAQPEPAPEAPAEPQMLDVDASRLPDGTRRILARHGRLPPQPAKRDVKVGPDTPCTRRDVGCQAGPVHMVSVEIQATVLLRNAQVGPHITRALRLQRSPVAIHFYLPEEPLGTSSAEVSA